MHPFRNTDNEKLENAILMAFDPFTNKEVYNILIEQTDVDLNDHNFLHNYYADPIKCLLRIKDSVDTWEKNMGSNGYFLFCEDTMGHLVTGEDMTHAVMIRTMKK